MPIVPVPRPRPSRRRSIAALGAATVLSLAVVGGCSSDDDGDATPTTEAEAVTSSTAATDADDTTTSTTEADAAGGDLVGTWVADADDLLAANIANLGGAPDISCEGPISLEFGDDGSFAQRGEATCSTGGIAASMTIETVGRYETSGGTLTITEAEVRGTMEAGGMSQPADVGFGVGEAGYEVAGDVLTITFTDPSVGTVTQTYQRG